MGRRGPAPTPTAILKARGSRRAKRPAEPVPPPGAPEKPAWVTGEAAETWHRLMAMLSAMGVVGACDGPVLGRYCLMLARFVAASKVLAEKGETHTTKTKRGSVTAPRPEVAIVNRLAVALLRIEQEFGLTASARSRLHVDQAKKRPIVSARTR